MRLLIAFVLFSGVCQAQVGTGQWRLHVPTRQCKDVAATSTAAYGAYVNGVLEYDFASKEVSMWDAVNGLSDISIACLGHSSSNDAVFIGYENGNIDKIKGSKVTNIPAIKLAEIQGAKMIHNIVEYEEYMYFATGFAIVKIDPVKNEVRDTYYPTNGNAAILDLAFRNDSIFALTSTQMYHGDINNVALADPTEWTVDSRVPFLSANGYYEIENVLDEIYVLFKHDDFGMDTVYRLGETALELTHSESFPMEINSISSVNDQIAFHFGSTTIIYDENFNTILPLSDYGFATPNVEDMFYSDGIYWTADKQSGMVELTMSGARNINYPGPPKEVFYSMDWVRGKLAVVSGGVDGNQATFNNRGVYVFEDEEWSLYDGANQNLWAGAEIYDFLTVAMHPSNNDQLAVGTYSFVPLSILDEESVIDTLTEFNSSLMPTTIGVGKTLVTAVEYDNQGNLWVLNGGTNEPLLVYTAAGTWQSFDLGTSAKSKFSTKMVIDYNGNKWLAFLNSGMYGFTDGGTPTDISDDDYQYLGNGEGNGGLPSTNVTALAVDQDNELWIGTDAGFAVLYNTSTAIGASSGDFDAQRIKAEFEGNVEYVLGTTHITDIEVDGGNRKWIATINSGLVLLSADGLEILEQHTIDNSPLISNTIYDLQMDHNTGELFIITDKGLISYRTDASQGQSNFDNVTVFPNPVRPDFHGPITIQGIKYDSDVRITDAAGHLVYETTSNGGTATWNGENIQGVPVETGVYLIWTAPNEGKGRKVGKVLVVR